MNHIYILEADPTAFGGIQQFVRNLASYFPQDQVTLLAYYGELAGSKQVDSPLRKILEHGSFLRRGYRSSSAKIRNLALLLDIPRIRRKLEQLLNGDTLVLNSAFAMYFLCTPKLLKENRIILVQHTCPRMMKRRAFDFGGVFQKAKIACFRKYVGTFVMLSPWEQEEFRRWLPFEQKNTPVIRHAMRFPAELPELFPHSVAVLARLIPLKRIDRVIAAANLLPDITFNIYGTGPQEQELKKLASGMNNVCFKGYTNDIDAVFRDNSILLITSDYEGYPVGGIEACVHGRPVIVLDTFPAAGDLVENGKSGIVLKDFSAPALAAAVKEILNDPGKFRRGALEHRLLYDPDPVREMWRKLLLRQLIMEKQK